MSTCIQQQLYERRPALLSEINIWLPRTRTRIPSQCNAIKKLTDLYGLVNKIRKKMAVPPSVSSSLGNFLFVLIHRGRYREVDSLAASLSHYYALAITFRDSNILTYQTAAIAARINLDDNGARVELLHCLAPPCTMPSFKSYRNGNFSSDKRLLTSHGWGILKLRHILKFCAGDPEWKELS